MKFVILVKEAIISSNTQAAPTAPEGHENEDIIIEAPTVAAAAASSDEGAAAEPPDCELCVMLTSSRESFLHAGISGFAVTLCPCSIGIRPAPLIMRHVTIRPTSATIQNT
jgi:hypothetical protein